MCKVPLTVAFCLAALSATLGIAAADERKQVPCSIEIGRSSFTPSTCTVSETDGKIEFRWASAHPRDYTGLLSLEGDDTAVASWNGFGASEATDSQLGRLNRNDACWLGDEPAVRICLYRDVTDAYATAEPDEYEFETAEEDLVDPNLAQPQPTSAPDDRSSFRGLFLGMPVSSIAASIDSEFDLSEGNSSGHELSQLAEMLRGMQQGGQSIFAQKAGMACAQIIHDGNVVTQINMYQCFFDLSGQITAEEFARQVLNRYPIAGMEGRQKLTGDGAYRFRYTEYTGHTETERFVVSHHELFNRVELAVSPVGQARF